MVYGFVLLFNSWQRLRAGQLICPTGARLIFLSSPF
ncbi:hypothetical protein SAMN05443248_0126 [Bradyrhizobium erythrophlei]|jgi:hypothetical protein|uniref:Uncharacterized protein n=1 Tax=Bradyrhizobium erythrophlei TaxID=1437360 RepID=A0A1M5GPY0_9BRAD|nr:hypothetical protein SAMN05443248_0126 [Bradyrhizobium erythrophlei]